MNFALPLTPLEFPFWFAGFERALAGQTPTSDQWHVLQRALTTMLPDGFKRVYMPGPELRVVADLPQQNGLPPMLPIDPSTMPFFTPQ